MTPQNPGCPLTTRQPAEIYGFHVMKPIHVQKWPLGPTHHTYKMYMFIQNLIYLQLYSITIYTKLGLLPRILQNTKKNTRSGHLGRFFASKVPDASHPQVRLRYLKKYFPRQGEQSPVVEFPYLGYSPPKCNAMAHKHPTHANISLMHILTILNPIPHVIQFIIVT